MLAAAHPRQGLLGQAVEAAADRAAHRRQRATCNRRLRDIHHKEERRRHRGPYRIVLHTAPTPIDFPRLKASIFQVALIFQIAGPALYCRPSGLEQLHKTQLQNLDVRPGKCRAFRHSVASDTETVH